MHITADPVLLTADDKSDLAVRLQADKSVDDMAACLLEHLRPLDVIFLIETCLQLDQSRDLFSVLGSLCQSRDDRRIAGYAVQRHLDGKNVRVLGRAADQVHDRIKGLIRMRQEDILLPDHGEQILVILHIHQRRDRLRYVAFLLQMLETAHAVHLHQEGQIQRSGDRIHLLIADVELLAKDLQKLGLHGILVLETDHLAPLALLQFLLDLFEQIVRIVLIDRQISISGDPVGMSADNVIAGEQLIHVRLDHILQKNAACHVFFL